MFSKCCELLEAGTLLLFRGFTSGGGSSPPAQPGALHPLQIFTWARQPLCLHPQNEWSKVLLFPSLDSWFCVSFISETQSGSLGRQLWCIFWEELAFQYLMTGRLAWMCSVEMRGHPWRSQWCQEAGEEIITPVRAGFIEQQNAAVQELLREELLCSPGPCEAIHGDIPGNAVCGVPVLGSAALQPPVCQVGSNISESQCQQLLGCAQSLQVLQVSFRNRNHTKSWRFFSKRPFPKQQSWKFKTLGSLRRTTRIFFLGGGIHAKEAPLGNPSSSI